MDTLHDVQHRDVVNMNWVLMDQNMGHDVEYTLDLCKVMDTAQRDADAAVQEAPSMCVLFMILQQLRDCLKISG